MNTIINPEQEGTGDRRGGLILDLMILGFRLKDLVTNEAGVNNSIPPLFIEEVAAQPTEEFVEILTFPKKRYRHHVYFNELPPGFAVLPL